MGIIDAISIGIWNFGAPLLMIVGAFFTLGSGFYQLRRARSVCSLLRRQDGEAQAGLTPFQALSTALSGTLGTGNILGVSAALAVGGPGTVFWMWVSAFLGMMTHFAEVALSVHFRTKDERGQWMGGPMVYLERGLRCRPLALLFSLFCVLASLGMGNMAQANAIAAAGQSMFRLPVWVTAAALPLIMAPFILGGIQRIGKLTERLVPLMSLLYVLATLAIVALHLPQLPDAFAAIFSEAFTFRAAGGGAAYAAMRIGIARGVFSNEAGLGASAIAHASSSADPLQQGKWGIMEIFIDTILLCTLTALAQLVTGAQDIYACFSGVFGLGGGWLLSLCLMLFAFATLLSWSYYGQQAASHLLGRRAAPAYRALFLLALVVGATQRFDLVWAVSDVFNALMALPNLIGVLALSGTVFALIRQDRGLGADAPRRRATAKKGIALRRNQKRRAA